MIPKAEILSAAEESGLFPTTIEKDYVLGWVLFAAASHSELKNWVFKGGTCLKKCFFDTYRFSEDLDFTVPEDGAYTHTAIEEALAQATRWVEREAGIEFPPGRLVIEELTNKRGQVTFQVRTSFVGPLRMPKSEIQRIKFDLTQDEIVVDEPEARSVYHPYSDAPVPIPQVRCYTLDEILAEKTRALYERSGRARDVFDIVNIARNFRDEVSPARARQILREKFEYKGLPFPSPELIVSGIDPDTLASDWVNALGHQLAVLPSMEDFLAALNEALAWWVGEEVPIAAPLAIPGGPDEQPVPRARFSGAPQLGALGGGLVAPVLTGQTAYSSSMDRIRYASRNRLLARLRYHGVDRLVEPYALRLPGTGNVLLYVFEVERGGIPSGSIKAFKVAEISSADVTVVPFHPRYLVEL